MAPTKKNMSDQKLPENMSLDGEHQKKFLTDLKETKKRVAASSDGPGVIYVGHIPDGFFEPQMAKYFSQFGKVRKLRLSRSKKSGKQKGYAFVQFASAAVAKVVAESMNNYLMFNRLLKCQVVPPEKVHPDTFKGCRKPFSRPKAHLVAKRRHNQPQSADQRASALRKMKLRTQKNLKKFAELGISVESIQNVFNNIEDIRDKDMRDEDLSSEDEAPATKKAKVDKSPQKKRSNANVKPKVMSEEENEDLDSSDEDEAETRPAAKKRKQTGTPQSTKKTKSPKMQEVTASRTPKTPKTSAIKDKPVRTPKGTNTKTPSKATPKRTKAADLVKEDLTASAKKAKLPKTPSQNVTAKTPKSGKKTPKRDKLSGVSTPKAPTPGPKKSLSAKKKTPKK